MSKMKTLAILIKEAAKDAETEEFKIWFNKLDPKEQETFLIFSGLSEAQKAKLQGEMG